MTDKQKLMKNEIRSFTTFQIFCEKKLNKFCKEKGFGEDKSKIWNAIAYQVRFLWGHEDEKLRLINDLENEEIYNIWLFCLGNGIEELMEEERNKTICKNCYGKGYSTLYRGKQIGSPDFPGDKYVKIKDAEIIKIPCKVCRSKEYETFKKKNIF